MAQQRHRERACATEGVAASSIWPIATRPLRPVQRRPLRVHLYDELRPDVGDSPQGPCRLKGCRAIFGTAACLGMRLQGWMCEPVGTERDRTVRHSGVHVGAGPFQELQQG